MSHITLQIRITFEDTIDPRETEQIAVKFDSHINTLIDMGFLDSYGTIYDYEVTADYNADDA